MSTMTLNINGMHCEACVRRVTQALERVPGTSVEEVRVGTARVQAETSEPLVAALSKAGFSVQSVVEPVTGADQQ